MDLKKLLSLFGEGGSEGESENTSTEVNTEEATSNESRPGGENAGENKMSDDGDADGLTREFDELIRGKYKKQFAERVSSILSRRFREKAQTEESEKEKTDSADKVRATERAARVYAGWEREAERLKLEYPDFDLRTESKNPSFIRLLRGGAGLREAYEVTHRDEIMPERLKAAVEAEIERLCSELENRLSRPDEHGSGLGSNAVTKRSVASLSKSERESLERRALRGEHIVL